MNIKKGKSADDEAKYKLTDAERVALGKQFERLKYKPAAPRIRVASGDNGDTVSLDHPNKLVGRGVLREALGTADSDFCDGIINQLIRAASHDGKVNERELNFMLSVIKGIRPKDELEAMLGAQMAAVHVTSMKLANQISDSETLQQQDSAERAFNKLTRTFIMLVEALKRHRTGGEQKVTVQHVSVSEGGQAIVGNVTQTSREVASKKSGKLVLPVTDARQPAMAIVENRARSPVAARRRRNDEKE
jgi:hypothetical protein